MKQLENPPMNFKAFKFAVRNAGLAYAYVAAVGTFMSNASKLFGEKDTWLTGVAVLTLLVFSAALMGILVFGQPVMWYIDGQKRPALQLLGYTMAMLFGLLVLTFAAMLLMRG